MYSGFFPVIVRNLHVYVFQETTSVGWVCFWVLGGFFSVELPLSVHHM